MFMWPFLGSYMHWNFDIKFRQIWRLVLKAAIIRKKAQHSVIKG